MRRKRRIPQTAESKSPSSCHTFYTGIYGVKEKNVYVNCDTRQHLPGVGLLHISDLFDRKRVGAIDLLPCTVQHGLCDVELHQFVLPLGKAHNAQSIDLSAL